jgi:hypothetical protein
MAGALLAAAAPAAEVVAQRMGHFSQCSRQARRRAECALQNLRALQASAAAAAPCSGIARQQREQQAAAAQALGAG